MARLAIVATAGAGGDLQPLVASALALQERGHEVRVLGDRSVDRSMRPLGLPVHELPSSLDLGPRLVRAVQDAMAATGGDNAAAGPIVQEKLSEWGKETALVVADVLRSWRPATVLTSLFGVEVLSAVSLGCSWGVVNSTFYVGPDPPRPLAEDFGPRAIPLIERFASFLGSADLVLHATDQVFDYGFDRLPPLHHYVGPLGIWEPPGDAPSYLEAAGDPWVLLTISSQLQDDLPLAQAAFDALVAKPLRVVFTLGPGHGQDELPPVPANVRVETTTSHSAVLERARLLVSHAGHGSVMKALWSGRPMVLVPWGRDQPGVAARARALGVASVVARESLSAETLSAAIDDVLADNAMASAARLHGDRLRATDSPAAAASLVESVLLG